MQLARRRGEASAKAAATTTNSFGEDAIFREKQWQE
jgi:hypothetical protein